MPYVPGEERTEHVRRFPQTPGQLNYAITQLCVRYLDDGLDTPPTYDDRVDVYGAMLAAAAEWYRRVLARYEDGKCETNGDVYPYWLTKRTYD